MPIAPKIRPVSDLRNLFESDVYLKLKEAEYQAASSKKRFSHEEVMTELQKITMILNSLEAV